MSIIVRHGKKGKIADYRLIIDRNVRQTMNQLLSERARVHINHYDQANIYQEIGLQYPVGKSRSRQKENEKNNQKIKHSAEQKIMDLLF